MRRLAMTALLLLAPALGLASPPRVPARGIRFSHLTVEHGLSNSWALDILKDRRGFLWVATSDGLNRYDGTRVVVYRPDSARAGRVPSSRVTSLLQDRRGRLWIGFWGSHPGVALYDRERDAFQAFAIEVGPPSTNGGSVRTMAEDSQGYLWLGTEAGLFQFDPEARRVVAVLRHDPTSPRSLSDDSILRLRRARDGRVWVATPRGLDVLDPVAGVVRPWTTRGTAADVLASRPVTDVLEDGQGVLWVATRRGLLRIDPSGAATEYAPGPGHGPHTLSAGIVRRLACDEQGTIYAGTENGGLNLIDPRTGGVTVIRADPGDPDGLSADSIWSLHVDDRGTLWVGTFNGGVDFFSALAQRFDVIRPRAGGLGNPHVSAVMEDGGGDLWIGTDGGGLERLDRRTGRFTRYRHDPTKPRGLSSNAVLALKEDAQGRIWIGTWAGGLQRLDPRTGRFTTFRPPSLPSPLHDSVWTLEEDGEGGLLVGTHLLGVQRFDPKRQQFTPLRRRYPGLEPAVTNPVVGRGGNGDLWIAHGELAQHLDRRTGEVIRHELGAEVTVLYEDSRRNVWFGTTEGGLLCLAKGRGRLRRYTEDDGLPSGSVVSILEDGDRNLWLGTRRGLVRFEGATQVPDRPRFQSFDSRDGLPGFEFRREAAFRSRAGEMFFGTQRGLAAFFPQHVKPNPDAPPVVLTGLRILNRPVEPGGLASPLTRSITEAKELRLSPAESASVTFEFAALNYVIPQKNQYRYRLEGFDRDWHWAGHRNNATYTNLPPGTYTFRVAGANNDGVWNEAEASLTVVREPSLYQRPSFFAAISLALVAAGWRGHRARMRWHSRLEEDLHARIQAARTEIRTLSGLLPVCTGCQKVRDDRGYWSQIESYVRARTDADFTHGICPDCRAQFSSPS